MAFQFVKMILVGAFQRLNRRRHVLPVISSSHRIFEVSDTRSQPCLSLQEDANLFIRTDRAVRLLMSYTVYSGLAALFVLTF